ncbi:MAG TPA: hypothetical protein V6C76_01335 [Drouetiella sp.]
MAPKTSGIGNQMVIDRHTEFSKGILEVREIIRSSTWPSSNPIANHHLQIVEERLRDLLLATNDQQITRIFAVIEIELAAAKSAALKNKAEQEELYNRSRGTGARI